MKKAVYIVKFVYSYIKKLDKNSGVDPDHYIFSRSTVQDCLYFIQESALRDFQVAGNQQIKVIKGSRGRKEV